MTEGTSLPSSLRERFPPLAQDVCRVTGLGLVEPTEYGAFSAYGCLQALHLYQEAAGFFYYVMT